MTGADEPEVRPDDGPDDRPHNGGVADEIPAETHVPPTVATVEALVRRQMATALGGRRGMIEAAVPGLLFTAVWLPTKDLRLALVLSLVAAAAAGVLRLLQRSTLQYVLNAFFSIGIGWVFVRIAASSGGSESDQALAFFLPGIIYSLVYTIVLGVLLPDPVAGGRLHGRQRHRRPHRLAPGPAGREPVHPAHLAARRTRRRRRPAPGPRLAARAGRT